MVDFKIFTESRADIVFIRQYIQVAFGIVLPDDHFFPLNSWAGYKTGGALFPDVQLAYDNGQAIVLMLDADNDFNVRTTEVVNDFKVYGIPMQLFLFPDHANNGNREDLLTNIAVDRQPINCFLNYEDCLKEYDVPLAKARIYAYLDAILPANCKVKKNDLRQDENRDYTNPAHWNLHHDYLTPLYHFLTPFLIP